MKSPQQLSQEIIDIIKATGNYFVGNTSGMSNDGTVNVYHPKGYSVSAIAANPISSGEVIVFNVNGVWYAFGEQRTVIKQDILIQRKSRAIVSDDYPVIVLFGKEMPIANLQKLSIGGNQPRKIIQINNEEISLPLIIDVDDFNDVPVNITGYINNLNKRKYSAFYKWRYAPGFTSIFGIVGKIVQIVNGVKKEASIIRIQGESIFDIAYFYYGYGLWLSFRKPSRVVRNGDFTDYSSGNSFVNLGKENAGLRYDDTITIIKSWEGSCTLKRELLDYEVLSPGGIQISTSGVIAMGDFAITDFVLSYANFKQTYTINFTGKTVTNYTDSYGNYFATNSRWKASHNVEDPFEYLGDYFECALYYQGFANPSSLGGVGAFIGVSYTSRTGVQVLTNREKFEEVANALGYTNISGDIATRTDYPNLRLTFVRFPDVEILPTIKSQSYKDSLEGYAPILHFETNYISQQLTVEKSFTFDSISPQSQEISYSWSSIFTLIFKDIPGTEIPSNLVLNSSEFFVASITNYPGNTSPGTTFSFSALVNHDFDPSFLNNMPTLNYYLKSLIRSRVSSFALEDVIIDGIRIHPYLKRLTVTLAIISSKTTRIAPSFGNKLISDNGSIYTFLSRTINISEIINGAGAGLLTKFKYAVGYSPLFLNSYSLDVSDRFAQQANEYLKTLSFIKNRFYIVLDNYVEVWRLFSDGKIRFEKIIDNIEYYDAKGLSRIEENNQGNITSSNIIYSSSYHPI